MASSGKAKHLPHYSIAQARAFADTYEVRHKGVGFEFEVKGLLRKFFEARGVLFVDVEEGGLNARFGE